MKTVILICALIGVAYAQNCGITGVDDEIVTIDSVLELTALDELIWTAPTFNVTGAAAIQHPHTRYLTGLRYASRYEYKATAVFNEFIKTEWNSTLVRNVVFTCSDTLTKSYTFLLNVIDENDQPPVFAVKAYTATVSQAANTGEPISANILVSDGDFELSNAQLIVRSSNALVTPFVDPTWTGQHPRPYTYRIDLIVSQSLAVGRYTIIFTADDGRASDYTVLDLEVTA
ncbi:uncharacterized protein LOC110862853 [Folsomia candida]|uniref:uncharacterized protein LOC110862853 n=1 Tax=Folsomia candida TaxID=158441 RepID=UPI000B9084CE|nr:uncharacterized protein LOC110862853 [Folsomia candida]